LNLKVEITVSLGLMIGICISMFELVVLCFTSLACRKFAFVCILVL